jgi:hypothetical protein
MTNMHDEHSEPSPPHGYLLHKAQRYLAIGPTRYRRGDALDRPVVGIPRAVLAAVRRAFAQLVDGAGTTAERPLEHVGTRPLYVALHIAHFRPVKQIALRGESERHFTDRIDFVHEVDPSLSVRIYNRVEAPTFD